MKMRNFAEKDNLMLYLTTVMEDHQRHDPRTRPERLRIRAETAAKPIDPHVLVVCGGTGDLMKRKLLPALHTLASEGYLHDRCMILGAGRSSELDDAAYRALAREALASAGFPAGELAQWCDHRLPYL